MKCLGAFCFILVAVVLSGAAETYQDNVATRSVKVEGILRCGKKPLADAVIRLFKSNSEDLGEVIAVGKSTADGKFSIEGDTSRFKAEDSEIDPYLRFYHQCEQKSGYKRVQLQFPKEFISLGKLPRRTYNVGLLNLELGFPGETTVKQVEGL
ncbi:unnamed protein product [Bursaphelenchus xylophilus]|uniref:(pine wood nematode) hypothetical protein n=1 Tax=Bursaphelenchus xylophilus TaxID=6326 RepID=A0A1I7SRP0_BURXY|nr:unnamed protein product [Bursaphelenchus xylophilus]CAG9102055.1 unnamed protein product [Bursaphelenchus xylophilus]